MQVYQVFHIDNIANWFKNFKELFSLFRLTDHIVDNLYIKRCILFVSMEISNLFDKFFKIYLPAAVLLVVRAAQAIDRNPESFQPGVNQLIAQLVGQKYAVGHNFQAVRNLLFLGIGNHIRNPGMQQRLSPSHQQDLLDLSKIFGNVINYFLKQSIFHQSACALFAKFALHTRYSLCTKFAAQVAETAG